MCTSIGQESKDLKLGLQGIYTSEEYIVESYDSYLGAQVSMPQLFIAGEAKADMFSCKSTVKAITGKLRLHNTNQCYWQVRLVDIILLFAYIEMQDLY